MKDYIIKIYVPDFPKTKKEMNRIVVYLQTLAKEFSKEKDLKIYSKRFTAKLMKK